jgi:thiamine pyrophosphate-dependent acetolactate synthase large subunit-like protein
MTGADVLIRDLKEAGVPCIYTLCGNGLEPILTACRRGGMRVIDTRNEQAAAYMADTAGRLTRRPGVVATSSGVAHLNALTGVCNAWFDGSPMLLITGATDSATTGRGNFQDMDSVVLSRPICKYAQGVNRAERISPDVREALRIALTGRRRRGREGKPRRWSIGIGRRRTWERFRRRRSCFKKRSAPFWWRAAGLFMQTPPKSLPVWPVCSRLR